MPTQAVLHIACDHAGFPLKGVITDRLAGLGYVLEDHGASSDARCDYPVFAERLCREVLKTGAPGILICGTGIGMSIAANRIQGIRAALCTTELHARLARAHNDANVLCLGARMTGEELAFAIVQAFLQGTFEGGRHAARLALIDGG
ncbi:MAG: ribose 5-phosphate isomerase B [Desulfovibrio sp.]|jgi:ribose 5-phosphate isomerase B|nr:ribose 5-phosphate isomerase B [Desulfovibrio sp.]